MNPQSKELDQQIEIMERHLAQVKQDLKYLYKQRGDISGEGTWLEAFGCFLLIWVTFFLFILFLSFIHKIP